MDHNVLQKKRRPGQGNRGNEEGKSSLAKQKDMTREKAREFIWTKKEGEDVAEGGGVSKSLTVKKHMGEKG